METNQSANQTSTSHSHSDKVPFSGEEIFRENSNLTGQTDRHEVYIPNEASKKSETFPTNFLHYFLAKGHIINYERGGD